MHCILFCYTSCYNDARLRIPDLIRIAFIGVMLDAVPYHIGLNHARQRRHRSLYPSG